MLGRGWRRKGSPAPAGQGRRRGRKRTSECPGAGRARRLAHTSADRGAAAVPLPGRFVMQLLVDWTVPVRLEVDGVPRPPEATAPKP